MRNNLENTPAMLNSDDLFGSSDSLIGNHHSPTLKQLNIKAKQLIKQNKSCDKIDNQEHKKADIDLESDLVDLGNKIITNSNLSEFVNVRFKGDKQVFENAEEYINQQNVFGREVTEEELVNRIGDFAEKENELSTAEQIKNFKNQLDQQGKSQTEILKILISKFENEEAVSTWVENWRNFLKLHQFAENKPPAERKAIQNIISKADFTSENAFEDSLAEISQSTEISTQTKLEISREFNGTNVFSVDDMDSILKEVKSHKQQIESAINTKSKEKETLDSEVKKLESEIDKLPVDDPKRQELVEKLEQQKEVLEQTETEIKSLKNAKPKDISFPLRDGFFAKLNPDGSRSIKLNSADFAIKLPSNFLPLTGTKNLRSINLAFPYLALKNQNIAGFIFSPNLKNDDVPNKENRKMGHLILSSLSIDDTEILSEEDIKQLNSDLSRLTSIPGKSGQECLIDFGVFDIDSQSLDKKRFVDILKFLRKNRGLENNLFWEKLNMFT